MVISIETMTVDCAVRHIRTLFYQCSEDRKADFGETCSQCPHMLECNCDYIFGEFVKYFLEKFIK